MLTQFPFPKPNDRVSCMGPTDSGKSYFMRWLLRQYANVIVIDPKGAGVKPSNKLAPGQWKWYDPKTEPHLKWMDKDPRFNIIVNGLPRLKTVLRQVRDTGYPVIYRPEPRDLLPENSHRLDEVARLALQRGNTILYYDELYFVANGSDFTERAPHYFFAVTTGRARGVGVWAAFQRPSWIPKVAVTESELRVTFFLREPKDRKAAEDLCGEVPWETLADIDYTFVYATDKATSIPTILIPENKELKGVA